MSQESYFTYSENEESLIDHDVHWRPGLGADGTETFMPRTVIYDLKGGFGSLRKINALYEIADETPAQTSSLWGGQTVVQKQDPIAPSAYQQSLDAGLEPPPLTTESVRYWSDFNRVFYHPRSIVQLNEYELNSSLVPFERWDTGEELFANMDKEHDLLDRDLRPFAEEADQMQGIQLMTTLDDAWGGFASKYMERLRDEYGKTTLWVWGIQSSFHGVNRVSIPPLLFKHHSHGDIDGLFRTNASFISSTRPNLSQSSTNKPPFSCQSPFRLRPRRGSATFSPSIPPRHGTRLLSSPQRLNPLPCPRASETPRIGTHSETLQIS